ncbi:Multivesicular body subunit 12B [Merluccius polli]|uniref:Multivesicular body subunit 12B n=1 Tax=Merluccius polli TaxID=89951 RepID=A0AA47N9J1_MERPO|nr:Multivesicular body subunit 12B [Merluccius polli]
MGAAPGTREHDRKMSEKCHETQHYIPSEGEDMITHMSDTLEPSRTLEQLPEPFGSVEVVASLHKVPDGYHVVAQTTDGCDADLWKDAIFKSKVTRYLCFTRKNQDSVVVDMKLIDLRDAMPAGFTPILQTLDTKEPALRKKRLCVKLSPHASAQTALYDIQVISKSKLPHTNYTCIGELNNMGIWYRARDLLPMQQPTPRTSIANKTQTSTARSRLDQKLVARGRTEETGGLDGGPLNENQSSMRAKLLLFVQNSLEAVMGHSLTGGV